MSYIPDCRNDVNYNEKNITAKDKEFVRGFDWCAEEVVDCFFDNLDNIDSDHLIKMLNEELPESMQKEYEWEYTFGKDRQPEKRIVKTYGDLLRSELIDWMEAERNELIVSMIDSMDEDEYAAIKEKVDGRIKSEERERAKED